MSGKFEFDVFLGHKSQGEARLRKLAERLNEAGLRVWFDEWIINPEDDIGLPNNRRRKCAWLPPRPDCALSSPGYTMSAPTLIQTPSA